MAAKLTMTSRVDETHVFPATLRSSPLPVLEKHFSEKRSVAIADDELNLKHDSLLSITPPGDLPTLPESPLRDLFDESPEDDVSSSSDDDLDSPLSAPFSAEALKDHPYARPGPMMDVGKEARRKMKVSRVPFHGKILVIGCGAVAQCVLPLLPRMIDMPLKNVQVVDIIDQSSKIRTLVDRGLKFAVEEVTKETMAAILAKYLKSGDLLLDLAYEIPTLNFLEWCRANNVMYINAALEVDNPYGVANPAEVQKFTLYERHQVLERRIASWGRNDGPTAVIEHGANPGLVSHFVKLALVQIAEKIVDEKSDENPARARLLRELIDAQDFPRLAEAVGVRAIHISERDTQVSSQPKLPGEFVNSWSPMGFFQEGIAPAELGWGTHERTLPAEGVEHLDGPQHQICIRTKGVNTLVRSWVPSTVDSGDIHGFVVRHGEAYTIPQHLSVYNEKGECVYRPTCHYAYCPSDSAVASLHELRARAYKPQPKMRVLRDDIIAGSDALGCLLLGHDFNAWWIGTVLDIEEARELIPGQNATVVQVAVGLASAMQWMIENPRQGVRVPDELPYDRILQNSLPYLGAFLSLPVDWTPIKAAERERDAEYRVEKVADASKAAPEDHWQFNSFLVQ